jgi:hypothetical protein
VPDLTPYAVSKRIHEKAQREDEAREFMNAIRDPRIEVRAKPSPDAMPVGIAANNISLRERTLFDRASEFAKRGYDRMRGRRRDTKSVVPSSGGRRRRRTRRVRFR